MHTLEGLRAGGRTVGIVSHVTELKSRVADRIEIVVKDDRTSTLRVTATQATLARDMAAAIPRMTTPTTAEAPASHA